MFIDRRFPPAIVCLAASALASGPAAAQAPAPATLDVQLMQQADALKDAGKYEEAAAKYEEMVQKFPQVPSVPVANFQAGYSHYLGGNYDAAIAGFKKLIEARNLAPEYAPYLELALSLSPQAQVAKAAKLQPNDPARLVALEDAVKQFDVYLTKYPNSDEVESASYSKSLALYQLEKFGPAMDVLRANMKKFAQSPTVQESQYLLALTLATEASKTLQKTPDDAGANAQYDESETLLRDIIAKNQNLALINDSQFQLGEMLLARGGVLTGKDDEKKRDALFTKALDAYRAVASKDRVVAAQKARITFFANLRNQAGIAKDMAAFQKYKRLVDKETEKLAAIEGRTDQTETAQFKSGLVFFTQGKMDETRVLYTHLEELGVLEDPEDKKQAQYFLTVSYAAQNVVDKAEIKYKEFENAHHADPIGQNLQLLMGAMYINSDSKVKDPNKAIEYFNEGIKLYPDGKAFGALVLARAGAQIELKQFDEALKALNEIEAKNPPKELAVDVAFYKGTIQVQTGKPSDAVATFKALRSKYPGTPQAEEAHAQIAQLLLGIDPKAALPEIQSFLGKFPKSKDVPAVMMALGRAQAATNQAEAALATLKKLAIEYPKSEPAPFTYFERGKILADQQKFADCLVVMSEFIDKYPDNSSLYQAYDFKAQILTSQTKGAEAIAVYDDFIAKHPKDSNAAEALLKLSALWKGYAENQGNYIVIDETKRGEWKKGLEKSAASAEKLIAEFPESAQVAQALNNLMDDQRLLITAKLKSEADLEKYFQEQAQKFSGHPGTQAKVLFTLAAYTYTKDKKKAVEQMNAAYKPNLKFAPDDLDLYGQALIENKKIDEAIKIYEKINIDNPLPPGGDYRAAPREIQEAQADYLAGLGKALQEKGDAASKEKGAKLFAELEEKYPWSPKMLEVNYGTAIALHDQKKDDDAIKRLQEVMRGAKATAELRAKSMLLLGKIHEANERYELAIDNYIKISVFYAGVPAVAAEGLWLGGQLLERQARGEIPMPTPTPKPAATPAAARATPKK